MGKRGWLSILALTVSLTASAQFYVQGSDPSSLRWSQVETPYYQLIYPVGADSLAFTYARALEQFRVPMGTTLGWTPGDGNRRKMPVVLHTRYPYANGAVSWAPRYMSLYTVPNPYGADPVPWHIQLASHEPRHQAQMETVRSGLFRVLGWFSGQIVNPVAWYLYLDMPLGEGDAVVAETGLTTGTRARTADFLNYYRLALDQDDWRNWYRWRFGSFKHYTPDHYALGYLTLAGTRVFGSGSMAMKRALDLSRQKPWLPAPYNLAPQMKAFTGQKTMNAAFQNILEGFNTLWQADAEARAPFTPLERITAQEDFSVEYAGLTWMNGSLYALRSGFVHNRELVALRGGEWLSLRPFSSHTSSLYAAPRKQRLYWSETDRDPRWELGGSSRVRYLDLLTGKVQNLSGEGRLYNPVPSPDESRLSVVEYPFAGGSALLILDADDGRLLQRIPAPEGLQLTESAWMGDSLYALGLNEGGFGLYRLQADGTWQTVLAPTPQKMRNLSAWKAHLLWVSDRDGSNQLYRYSPADGRLVQLSAARYGLTDYSLNGDTLYCNAQVADGTALFRTSLSALRKQEVSFADLHQYWVEDALTAQETVQPKRDATVPVSAPQPYKKLSHLLYFHSWLPAYVNPDNIRAGSMDITDYETVALGATAFFQNPLGSLYGQVGYNLHPDPDTHVNWRNSLHAQLNFRAWYPVVEVGLNFGDKAARRYNRIHRQDLARNDDNWMSQLTLRDVPSFSGNILTYLPLAYNSGGILRGITPQIRYSFSNSQYNASTLEMQKESYFEGYRSYYLPVRVEPNSSAWMQRLSYAVRAYVMLPRARSQVYPRWGLGAEVGGTLRPGLTHVFAPVVYAYGYAYLPGFRREQGLRVSGLLQRQLRRSTGATLGDWMSNPAPRGFLGTVGERIALNQPTQLKLTADYAIPIYAGDLSLGFFGYVKNFLLSPHADFSLFRAGHLWSAGANFTAQLGSLPLVNFDSTLGISFSWLGGNCMEAVGQTKPYYIGLIFSVDL